MANVQVIQRHAHLAGAVKLDVVNGRDGKIAKALLTAISNTRRGSGDSREEESTAIQWTLWGKQAENAAEYLSKGSHVNIVGRLRNNKYEKDGEEVYALAFTAEEVDTSTAAPNPKPVGCRVMATMVGPAGPTAATASRAASTSRRRRRLNTAGRARLQRVALAPRSAFNH